MSARGTLFLVPNSLDLGTPAGVARLDEVLPMSVLRTAARLAHWVAENAKTTRAFLKRVDTVVPLAAPLQALSIAELPRPAKGGSTAAAGDADLARLLEPAQRGFDIGLISEAGLPAVADPGAALVLAAHAAGVPVVALSGPSAIVLALAASGLNGQSFAFVGYLPVEAAARAARIRALEAQSRAAQQTQLMIETPYRNQALFDALVAQLRPTTRLCVACGVTLPGGYSRTARVAEWRAQPLAMPADMPAVFALLA